MGTAPTAQEVSDRLSQLFAAAEDVIFTLSPLGLITSLNQRFVEMTGWDTRDWIGKSFAPLIHPDDLPKALGVLQAQATGKRMPLFTLRIKVKTGGFIVGEFSNAPIMTNGHVSEIVGIARDITERVKASEQAHILSQAIRQSPASVVITDATGIIQYVNPKFTQITGYTAEEAIGQNPRILKSGKVDPTLYTQLWTTITGGNEWHGELINKKKNGELYWEQVSISPALDESGKITHFIAVKEDISKVKQATEELIKRTQELERMNKLMVGRELKMMELKKQLRKLI